MAEALLTLLGMTSELDNKFIKNIGKLSVSKLVVLVAGVVTVWPVMVVAVCLTAAPVPVLPAVLIAISLTTEPLLGSLASICPRISPFGNAALFILM